MKKMNIAFFINASGEHEKKWIDKFFLSNNCIVFCTQNLSRERWVIDSSIPVYNILPNTFPIFHFSEIKKKKDEIAEILLNHEIDICHSMYAYPYAFWPYIIGVKKHVVTTRGSDILIDLEVTFKTGRNLKEKIIHYFLRKTMINALRKAQIITLTSLSQIDVLKKYVDPKKLNLIRTGLNLEQIDIFLKSESYIEKDVPYIFSPRFMAPLYNIELIIEAFEILIRKGILCKLILIDNMGETEYALSIRKMVRDKKLESFVEFIENQTFEGMVKYLKYADITVMVPFSDGTPNSGLEAMYSKSPLIIGPLNYDEDIFNNQTCYKLSSWSKIELFELMEKLLVSRDLNMINYARDIVSQKANLKMSLKEMENLYKKLISQ